MRVLKVMMAPLLHPCDVLAGSPFEFSQSCKSKDPNMWVPAAIFGTYDFEDVLRSLLQLPGKRWQIALNGGRVSVHVSTE